jgi:hypothetical protein
MLAPCQTTDSNLRRGLSPHTGNLFMNLDQAKVGTRVKSNVEFCSVPLGTQGVIDEDYGTGVMVAWDLSDQPLPAEYRKYDGRPAIASGLLRDGFDKAKELKFLDVV